MKEKRDNKDQQAGAELAHTQDGPQVLSLVLCQYKVCQNPFPVGWSAGWPVGLHQL